MNNQFVTVGRRVVNLANVAYVEDCHIGGKPAAEVFFPAMWDAEGAPMSITFRGDDRGEFWAQFAAMTGATPPGSADPESQPEPQPEPDGGEPMNNPDPLTLRNMPADELEALIRRRYADAVDAGRIDQIRRVAVELGDERDSGTLRKWEYLSDDGRYTFAWAESYDERWATVTNDTTDRVLVSTWETERFYIPGAWETVLTEAVAVADAAIAQRNATADERRRAELLALALPDDGAAA